jgi:hypothetical protein
MRGFEKVLAKTDVDVTVVPFAINNMWGDTVSGTKRD